MTPFSVIDIGSNTIHLLVGEVEGGAVRPVRSELIAARLGEGLERTGRIEEARFAIAIETVALMARIAASERSAAPVIVATSAAREAQNGAALISAIQDRTGFPVRMLSGEEEARLGFRGAFAAGSAHAQGRALVIDLGGGSAQFTVGDPDGDPKEVISLPIGTGRMIERFLPHDPPTPEELQTLRRETAALIPTPPLPNGTAVVAIGGSARALRSFTEETLTAARLQSLAIRLSLRSAPALALERGMTPSRARALPAAAAVLAGALDHLGLPALEISPTGLREGVLLAQAAQSKGAASQVA